MPQLGDLPDELQLAIIKCLRSRRKQSPKHHALVSLAGTNRRFYHLTRPYADPEITLEESDFHDYLVHLAGATNLNTLTIKARLPRRDEDLQTLDDACSVFASVPNVEVMYLKLVVKRQFDWYRPQNPDPLFTYDFLAQHFQRLETLELRQDEKNTNMVVEFSHAIPLLALPRLSAVTLKLVGGGKPKDVDELVSQLGGRPSNVRSLTTGPSNLSGELLRDLFSRALTQLEHLDLDHLEGVFVGSYYNEQMRIGPALMSVKAMKRIKISYAMNNIVPHRWLQSNEISSLADHTLLESLTIQPVLLYGVEIDAHSPDLSQLLPPGLKHLDFCRTAGVSGNFILGIYRKLVEFVQLRGVAAAGGALLSLHVTFELDWSLDLIQVAAKRELADTCEQFQVEFRDHSKPLHCYTYEAQS
ncbi:hypothetical protein BZA05DRAFT_245888 [Tricharina praecox]|uniref:uncharacterized protein n=1 Tax=Tricharina praecox TaxID=43433 RepID=UPI0022208DE7|nr:uncharacterized protein BZA05DRAFT_245888 [Tricharina praecox]KAI5854609.1 hypothetical protein BZA05DRAFT_245888 [Tricharina praecox]